MEFGTMYSSFYCSLSTQQIADRRRSLHHCDQTFKALYILCSLTSHHRFFDFHLRECPSFEPNEYSLSLSSFSAISLQIDVESSGRVYNERSLRQRIDGQHLHYFNLHLTPVLYQSRFIPWEYPFFAFSLCYFYCSHPYRSRHLLFYLFM